MNKLKSIWVILLIVACHDYEQNVLKKVTGDSHKYWDVLTIGNNGQYSYENICYFFDRSGLFKIYRYNKGLRTIYDGGDVVIPEVWSYLSDSTIMIATAECKIEKLTEDSFIYLNPYLGRKILVKSNFQDALRDTTILKGTDSIL